MPFIIDMLGTFAFAITGAYKAIQYKLDWLGVLILATATGVGGGILRDVMLDLTPPVAFNTPAYIIVCALASIITLKAQHVIKATWNYVLIADALGLGFFTAVGASKAAAVGASPVAIVCMAAVTAAGGGALRDILVSEIPQILKSDFYATAAITGGILFVVLRYLGVESIDTCTIITTVFTFALRVVAMRRKLHLPQAK